MSKPVTAKRGTVVAPNAMLYISGATLHKFLRPTQVARDVEAFVSVPHPDPEKAPTLQRTTERVEDTVNRPAAVWTVVFSLIGHPDERGDHGVPLARGVLEVNHEDGVDPLKAAYGRLSELVLTDGWTFEV